MTLLSNMKIGKKIGVVLGAVLLLMTALSVLSLWALQTIDKNNVTLVQRLTKARLAGDVAGDTSTLAQRVGIMVLSGKMTDDDAKRIQDVRATRNAALEQFQKLADTPTSIQHGKDLGDLVKSMVSSSDQVINGLKNGNTSEAAKAFREYARTTESLYGKAKEATKFQLDKADEVDKSNKETESTIWTTVLVGSLAGIAGAIFAGIVLTRGIATPLAAVVAQVDSIAKGDLSKDTSVETQERKDEIGVLACAMQTMIVGLRRMVQEISSGIQVLSSSSTELLASSDQMTSASRHASEKANSVSAAAEQMSSNATSVAAGMEQTSTNLGHVSTATDQMTSTITEIASNSEKARRITDDATRQASRITEQINELGAAAREIGKVTETITEISSQTNLLALNATIEAARAGAAGKGFAVVANEIKALAQQTAAATEDIKTRIASVQASTSVGITEVGKISSVIGEVSAIVNSIAAAIEEQAASTKDIARNIAEASTGVSDANARVAETSAATKEIARDTVEVNGTAREMAEGSDRVRDSARDLSNAAETLKLTVSRFHV